MEEEKNSSNLTLKHFVSATQAILGELYTPKAFRKYLKKQKQDVAENPAIQTQSKEDEQNRDQHEDVQ
jgi:hypothetical protein